MGRVHRDIERQLHQLSEQARPKVQELLGRTGRILTQQRKDTNKLYALHAPEVECIAKGRRPSPGAPAYRPSSVRAERGLPA